MQPNYSWAGDNHDAICGPVIFQYGQSIFHQMPNIVSRTDVRRLLDEWSRGIQTAAQIHDWAEARFAVDAWYCEDDVVNEVLAELDTLDMNLLTTEEVPALCAMLDLPQGQASLAHDLLKSHLAGVSLDVRKKELAADPTYAPFCRQ